MQLNLDSIEFSKILGISMVYISGIEDL